jgi:hypothetical protein
MTCHRAGGEHELGVVTSPIFERQEAAAMKVALTGGTGFVGSHILTELGWQPSHPSLTEEFRRGSYRK